VRLARVFNSARKEQAKSVAESSSSSEESDASSEQEYTVEKITRHWNTKDGLRLKTHWNEPGPPTSEPCSSFVRLVDGKVYICDVFTEYIQKTEKRRRDFAQLLPLVRNELSESEMEATVALLELV
jgi:hypothetical protein